MAPLLGCIATRTPFFYGWIIVAQAIVYNCSIHFGNLFINMLTMARLYDDFAEQGVLRSSVSFMWMFGSIGASFGTPFYGMAIDRWGARTMVPVGLIGLACAMWTLAAAGAHPPTFYLLPVAFFMMRSCANGMVSPFSQNVTNQWFDRRRGRAISMLGVSCMLISANPIFGTATAWQDALDGMGWRAAHVYGAFIPLLMAIPARLFLFSTPESVGCTQDGDPPPPTADRTLDHEDDEEASLLSHDDSGKSEQKERQPPRPSGSPRAVSSDDFTRAEALRTLPLYLLCVDIFFSAIIGAGCSQVFMQVLKENGAVGVDIARHVVVPQGMTQATLPLITGWLRDRGVRPKYLVALSSFLVALAPFTATRVRTPALAIFYGMNVGGVWGIKGTMSAMVFADFYGRTHLGSIMALNSSVGLLGTAVGPLYIQMSRELQGSYTRCSTR